MHNCSREMDDGSTFMTYKELTRHAAVCPRAAIRCPMGCEQTIYAKTEGDFERHYDKECPNVWVQCIHCQAAFVRTERAEHVESFCGHAIVRCKQCNAKILRKDRDRHIFVECEATSNEAKFAFASLCKRHDWDPMSIEEVCALER